MRTAPLARRLAAVTACVLAAASIAAIEHCRPPAGGPHRAGSPARRGAGVREAPVPDPRARPRPPLRLGVPRVLRPARHCRGAVDRHGHRAAEAAAGGGRRADDRGRADRRPHPGRRRQGHAGRAPGPDALHLARQRGRDRRGQAADGRGAVAGGRRGDDVRPRHAPVARARRRAAADRGAGRAGTHAVRHGRPLARRARRHDAQGHRGRQLDRMDLRGGPDHLPGLRRRVGRQPAGDGRHQ